jgi:DNA-binding transcriptional MocR family regulator
MVLCHLMPGPYSGLAMALKQDPLPGSGLVAKRAGESGFVSALGSWRDASGPTYFRLARAVISAISCGAVPAGSRVPAERWLSARLGVSRTTIVAAYAHLREEGWLESKHGSGSSTRIPNGVAAIRGSQSGANSTPQRVSRVLGAIQRDTIDFRCASLPDLGALTKRVLSFGGDVLSSVRETGYFPLGLPELRRAVARHVTRWGLPTREEQILVTGGAQQALGLVAALYLRPGDRVAIEDPTHMGAIDVFDGIGARMLPVAIGRDGVRVDALRQTIEKERPQLISLVPTFQNPTGTLLPESSRRRVARLCEEFDVPLLENNALGDLGLDLTPPPPIAAFSQDASILLVGSLSKLVWAGLRIGWIRAAEPLIARLASLKTIADYGTSVLSQAAALKFFRDADRIRGLRQRQMRERRSQLFLELDRLLPSWSYSRPAGGPSAWIRLPRGSAVEFALLALRYGVSVLPGDVFSLSGGFSEYLRLPFMLEPDVIREGVSRLARAWEAYDPVGQHERQSLRVII